MVSTAKRLLGSVAFAVVPLVVLASPASAQIIGLNVGATISCGWRGDQNCDGAGQIVPGIGLGGSQIAVTCTAVTPYDVQVTGVNCYIKGDQTGDVHWASAQWTQKLVSTTYATFASGLTSTSYKLCVGAGVIDNGGNTHGVGGFSCFTPL
jgi:hypothetical protein